jgi:adenine-specific DNA-methyltransferase
MEPVELVYLDPPYNQHPYGSNYFMLNLILDYQRPAEVSRVSGIPVAWQRSDYNVRTSALIALSHLVSELPTRFVLLSFSDDGFLDPNDLMSLFSNLGKCQVFNNDYNTYRASRNLSGRSLTVTEHLFLLEKS